MRSTPAGKVVAPGFIDVHTHDDTALIDNPTMAMKASQGVTTVVCGNCGVSAAPYLNDDVGHWMSLIIKNKANAARTFAEFAGKVDAAKAAINGAFLIGHGTLRMNTMGDDLDRVGHRARDQADARVARPEPRAGRDRHVERAVLCRVQRRLDRRGGRGRPAARQWGGVYTAHMRDEGDHILKAMDETFEIGRRAGARSSSRTTNARAAATSAAWGRPCPSSPRR